MGTSWKTPMKKSLLTIVLTLKGRLSFTYRWMDYMNAVHCPFPIVICDGSTERQAAKDLMDAQLYTNITYRYERFPFDATLNDFWKKLSASLDHVDTPYVVYTDNDDFLFMAKLEESLAFLVDNPDYVSCGAPPLQLYVDNLGHRTTDDLLSGSRISVKHSARGIHLSQSDPVERLYYGLNNYYPNGWYNIHKTYMLRHFFNEIVRIDFDKTIFFEYLFCATLSRHGKVKFDASPFLLRQMNTSMGSGVSGLGGDNLILLSLFPSWSRNVSALVEAILNLLPNLTSEEREQSGYKIREILAKMFRQTYQNIFYRPPWYTAIANRLGLRETRVWKALRSVFVFSIKYFNHFDPFFIKRIALRRLIKANPELANIQRFIDQPATHWIRCVEE